MDKDTSDLVETLKGCRPAEAVSAMRKAANKIESLAAQVHHWRVETFRISKESIKNIAKADKDTLVERHFPHLLEELEQQFKHGSTYNYRRVAGQAKERIESLQQEITRLRTEADHHPNNGEG